MILYKYVDMPSVKKILTSSRIGFSLSRYFNDPFDKPVATPDKTSNPVGEIFAGVRAVGEERYLGTQHWDPVVNSYSDKCADVGALRRWPQRCSAGDRYGEGGIHQCKEKHDPSPIR